MNKTEIIEKVADFVKVKQTGETTGHDWWHTYRVWQLAKKIAQLEGADLYLVELAALLHDLEDWKFNDNNDHHQAQQLLQQLGVEEKIIAQVIEIIKNLSFKGAKVPAVMSTIEGQVVQDADRLDALGAIGIARVFAYGGFKGQEIYNPDLKPVLHESFEQYKNTKTTTINHFYEKILLLKDLMNTKTAKAMAKERHEYMVRFVADFMKEWNNQ